MSKYKMKGGEFNEAVETRCQGNEETPYQKETQRQNGQEIKTSEQEKTLMRWFDIDKTVGESRFWQIVGAILLIAVLYFVIFQLGGM